MRKILFRGYSTAQRKWFYGNLIHSPDINHPCICNKDAFVNVSKSTVGQYTGLTDNTKWEQLTKEEQSDWLKNHTEEEWNGKKIFEGDILKAENFIGVVKYNEVIASFIVEINDTITEYIHWSPLNEGDPSRQLQLQYTEKLGNIYDNPELLKGGVDK